MVQCFLLRAFYTQNGLYTHWGPAKALWILPAVIMAIFFTPLHAQKNISYGGISGTVTESKQPLPGAVVTSQGTGQAIITGFDGRFTLNDIPAGKQVIMVTYVGYNTLYDTVEVIDKRITEVGNLAMTGNEKLLAEVKVISDYKRGSQSKAINMMHTSTGITSVLASDEVSKLPDLTAADMLKRMAGVVVRGNMGEGAYVSLRGTPEDWTSTLFNGNRMPVADESNISRTFEFQVLPAELIDYTIISKSVTADIEGDNIGGSINFITQPAADERTLKISLSLGYRVMGNKPAINGGITWGDRSKNGKFGYIINVVNNARDYTAQNQNVIYGDNFNQAINRMELNQYSGFRNTIGVHAGLEYKFTPGSKLSANFLYGNMQDQRTQYKTSYNWAESNGETIRLQSCYGVLVRQLIGGEIKSETELAQKLKLDVQVASYYNLFTYGPSPFGKGSPANGYHVIEFAQFLTGNKGYTDRIYTDMYGNAIDTAGGVPNNAFLGKFIGSDDPYGTGDNPKNIQPHLNVPILPQNFSFTQAYSEINRTVEQDPIVVSANLHYNISPKVKLQFGGKARYKTGSRNISLYQWLQNGPVSSARIKLIQFQTQPFPGQNSFLPELGNNYKGTFMPVLTHNQIINFVKQLGDSLIPYPMNVDNVNYLNFVGSSYQYTEQAYAGYAMVDAQPVSKLSINVGLRLEETRLHEYADSIIPTLVLDTAHSVYYYPLIRQAAINNYLAILPALNLNYAVRDNMNLRFAITRTFHRPNFAESKPGYPQYNYNALEFNFGNPNLKPTYSINFDATWEYYWGNKGMLSVGAYYKYVTNHIFATITADYDPSTGIIYKSYENAPMSQVAGAEASITRKFDFLPKGWNGLGINANITYSWSRMQVPGRDFAQAMPEQTPLLYNVALFYEKYNFSIRLALNYTGAYLSEINTAAIIGSNGQPTGQLLHQNTDFDVFVGHSYSLEGVGQIAQLR